MLTYNTHKKPIVLPEYGRLIQSMVDHALTIEDREERTACAYSIVKAMKTLVKTQPGEEESEKKYWDHLAIISNFKLDIEWPFEIIREETIHTRPEPMPYDGIGVNRFQYGRNLVNMLDASAELPAGPERDAAITLVANQMKKASLAWDDEGYSDERVFHDIANITEGKIVIQPGELMLCEFTDAPKPGKKKKKK